MKKEKSTNKIKDFLKVLDIYAKPIQMTHKGKEKFSTTFGGCLSLLILMLILSLFMYKCKDMVLRNLSQIKKNTLVSISNSYSPPQNLSAKNITFAFRLQDFWGSQSLYDPHYGTFILQQFIYTIKHNDSDGTTYRIFENYDIPFSPCELNKNFFYPNAKEVG